MSSCDFCGADRALPNGQCGACGCPQPVDYDALLAQESGLKHVIAAIGDAYLESVARADLRVVRAKLRKFRL